MLFIIWLGATIFFWIPRQFGINPSSAGLFTSAPEVERFRDVVQDLQDTYEELIVASSKDGVFDNEEAIELGRYEALIAEYEGRNAGSAFEREFGLGDPLILQYWRYITSLAQFDLGASQRFFPVSVFSVIRNSLFWTLGLMGVATVIGFLVGSLAGALMGWPAYKRFSQWGFLPMLAASSIPFYLLGWILIWFLAFSWGLFPLQYGWDVFDPTLQPEWSFRFIISAAHHSVLPALSVIVATAGFWTVTMRGLMVNMLGEDFMVFAEAKGLKQRRIFFQYGLRNSMLPQITGLAASVGSLLTGVLLVEIVFSYPGIGLLFRQAIGNRDFAMMSGIGFVMLILLGVSLFLVDILLPLLDRRIRVEPT